MKGRYSLGAPVYVPYANLSAERHMHAAPLSATAVEAAGGMPFVPFKSNTLEPTKAGTWAKMYHLLMYERDAFMEHYHKRSNIETAYSMIKGKFGSALRSKSDTGQINEVLCKVLAHNICVLIQAMHALNIHPVFRDVQRNAGRVGCDPVPGP